MSYEGMQECPHSLRGDEETPSDCKLSAVSRGFERRAFALAAMFCQGLFCMRV